MKRLVYIFAVLFLLLPYAVAFAQGWKISGVVTDESGEPLAGAIVVVNSDKGELKSSSTADANGQYSVKAEIGDVIIAYYLGYQDKKVTVEQKGNLDIAMTPDISTKLDEVVVIGFGSVKKSDLTGSVANINMGDIKDMPVSSVEQALQGRVAGMDVMSTSGEPSATTSIRIRGSRSISASNEPLIVVDGIMDAISDLNDLNPVDVESISVLKDASSTAIYGARGANGVILVTTKGSTDTKNVSKLSISFKADAGVSMMPSQLDLMDATEFANYLNDYRLWSGNYTMASNFEQSIEQLSTPISMLSYKDPASKGKGTDWVDEITRVAPYQNYNVSLNTTRGNSKIYASVGYNDNEGIIKKSGEKKITANMNVSTQLFSWFNLGVSARYTYRDEDVTLGRIGGTNIYWAALYLSPLIDPHDSFNALYGSGTRVNNPVAAIKNDTYTKKKSTLNASVTGDFTIIPDLKFKTKFSYYRYDQQQFRYNPSTLPAKQEGAGGDASRQDYQTYSMTWDNTLTYAKTWNKTHKFDAMLGFTGYSYGRNVFQLSGAGYQADDVLWNDMGAVRDKNSYNALTDYVERRTMSVFGRVNYSYDKRYYITVTARTDGASNFAANHKWGFFPSCALRWNIANEPFFRGVRGVDELSLKLSAGRSGNDAISPYMSIAALKAKTDGYVFGNIQESSYYQTRIASPELTWEKTDLFNLALTGSFLNSRLSFTAEAYLAYTSDLLLSVQVAQQTGYSSRWDNIGRTSNKGLELSIESRNVVKRNFSWSTAFTISHNTQMVEDIGSENYIATYTSPNSGYMMYGYMKGYPLNALWGFKYAGVWHNEEEVSRAEVTHAVASKDGSKVLGASKYIDVNHDGALDQADLCYLGDADPFIYGGLQNNFMIGQFKLSAYFTYSIGGKVYNYSELYMGSRRTNQYKYMLNAWHPVRNPESDYPRAGVNADSILPSSFQVHDASYLRLQNLTLGYTFKFRPSVPLKDLTLSASGENLFLVSKYNGYDPDVADVNEDSGAITRHMDLSAYPKCRRVVFSIQIRY